MKKIAFGLIAFSVMIGSAQARKDDVTSSTKYKTISYIIDSMDKLRSSDDWMKKLCRKGDIKKGVFSLRSGKGVLCKEINGATLAAFICSDYKDFNKSHCYKNAEKVYKKKIFKGEDKDYKLKDLFKNDLYAHMSAAGVFSESYDQMTKVLCKAGEKFPKLKEFTKGVCK